MPSTPESDRRRVPRDTMVGWPAQYGPDDDTGPLLSTSILDSSPEGAFVVADEAARASLHVGLPVRLHGRLWGVPFALRAEVAWIGFSDRHHVFGFGVRFDHGASMFRLLHAPPRGAHDAA